MDIICLGGFRIWIHNPQVGSSSLPITTIFSKSYEAMPECLSAGLNALWRRLSAFTGLPALDGKTSAVLRVWARQLRPLRDEEIVPVQH